MKEFYVGQPVKHIKLELIDAVYVGRDSNGKIKVIHVVDKPMGVIMATDYYDEEFIVNAGSPE
jgi:hypothetical protein